MSRGDRILRHVKRDYEKFICPLEKNKRILDYGCGEGDLIQALLTQGFTDVIGYEVSRSKYNSFLERGLKKNLIRLYRGSLLGEPNNSVDFCISWFVFEHIQNPLSSLRELLRVTKPGGVIIIYADEVLNMWDGHVNLPMPPLMPHDLLVNYLGEFGLSYRASYLQDYVFPVTSVQLAHVAKQFGCTVHHQSTPRKCEDFVKASLNVGSPREAVDLARRVRSGEFTSLLSPPEENLTLILEKQII